jgi:hypothetical protein
MAKIEWFFRNERLDKGDAQLVGEYIDGLKRRNATAANPKGSVTPEELYEDARDPESPLHRFFTWDVEHAAKLWNLKKAQDLIRDLDFRIIEADRAPVTVSPAFVRIRPAGEPSRYVSSEFAMGDEENRNYVMEQARVLIASAKARLVRLSRFSPEILSAIDQVLKLIDSEAAKKTKKKP